MAFLKGIRKTNGYVQVGQNVEFLGDVQFRYAHPWSKTYFVDGASGVDTNDGTSPTSAKLTIDAAVQLMARGDVCYIRPKAYVVGTGFGRYTETATIDLAQSDLSIIGITNSLNVEYGPRWSKLTSGYNVISDGPSAHFENIGFFSEGATGTALLRNDGASNTQRGTDGTTFYNCVIKGGYIFTLSGGDGTTIKHCRFHGAYPAATYPAGINASASANPGRRLIITDNIFQDSNGSANGAAFITIAPPYSEILIANNHFGILPTGSVYISAAGSSNTGLIANNYFAHADLDTDAEILPGGCFVVAQYDVGGLATTA